MPIYEYECRACGHHLEALQKLREAPLSQCPNCGKPTLRKLVSAAGFRLKGGGWYETDFKSANKRNVLESGERPAKETADKKPAETATAKSDKPAKKPEVKPAAKSEAKKSAASSPSS